MSAYQGGRIDYSHTNIRYDKSFAILPKYCLGDKLVWFETYYKVYHVFVYGETGNIAYHLYHLYNLTSNDAIVNKLKGI